MKRISALFVTAVFIFFSSACRKTAPQSKEIGNIPCEVKLLLNNDLVLDEDKLLSENILEKLMLDKEYENYEAAFLDTADRAFLSDGWVNRIRMEEGKKKYTISYKKRFKVNGEDLEGSLEAAAAAGFPQDDQDFEPEVDWGYRSMTLSFKNETKIKTKKHLPEGDAAVEIVMENMPSREKRSENCQLEVVGPLKLKRYNGSEDDNIRVEVWEIAHGEQTWYITEYSIECESVQNAVKQRESAIQMLDALGILLHEDGLKTEMILLGKDEVKTEN